MQNHFAKVSKNLFADLFIRPAIHHVQFPQFALIADRHMAKLSIFSPLGEKSNTNALL